MTAIDVADLMMRGRSDTEIAMTLSTQREFDRASALKKGQTDGQIIQYLVTKPVNLPENLPAVDRNNRSEKHADDGDKQFRQSNYGRAAKEYSLAIAYSDKSVRPYQSRAEAYMQHMKTVLFPSSSSSTNGDKMGRDRSKALLCHAIHFDYAKANDMNRRNLAAINADIYLLAEKMKKDDTNYELKSSDSKVAPHLTATPYHDKSTQQSIDMARWRRFQRLKKDAIRNGVSIKTAMRDYEQLCQATSRPAR
jgi:hypothetical protein